MIRKTLFIIVCFCTIYGFAQDAQLSQFYEADLLLNPALTGSKYRNRFVFHDRIQWPGTDGVYLNSFLSFDKYFAKKKLGVGTYIEYDQQGRNILSMFRWQILASYEIDLSDKWAIKLGLDAGFYTKRLDDSGLIYPEQVSAEGISSNFDERIGEQSYSHPDIGTGFLLYNENFWFGSAFSHINSQSQNFLEGAGAFPFRYNLIMGYKINLYHTNPTLFTGHIKDFYLFPSIHYKMQGKSDQFEIGSHLINEQFKMGLYYRGIPFKKEEEHLHNNESLIVILGWKMRHWEFSYSYDIVFSELSPARTRGAHELLISFVFPLEPKHKIYKKRLPCPDFNKSTKRHAGHF